MFEVGIVEEDCFLEYGVKIWLRNPLEKIEGIFLLDFFQGISSSEECS